MKQLKKFALDAMHLFFAVSAIAFLTKGIVGVAQAHAHAYSAYFVALAWLAGGLLVGCDAFRYFVFGTCETK